mgnify:CR=1 FL=1
MKKFNKTIEVKVSVDSIADKLLYTMSSDGKHNELVTETIIGNLLSSSTQGMSQLYNALNGYNNDIDFKVNDIIICSEKTYNRVEEDGEYVEKYVAVGECRVIEVDIYRSDKLKVEYSKTDSLGNTKLETRWVSHSRCDKKTIEPIEDYAILG